MPLSLHWRHTGQLYQPPPGGRVRCQSLEAPGGRWCLRPAAPAGQPPGEEVVGYDLQVVRTAGTLVRLASGDVLVTYYIDRTGPTGVYRPPERSYRMCDICRQYGISIDPADHILFHYSSRPQEMV